MRIRSVITTAVVTLLGALGAAMGGAAVAGATANAVTAPQWSAAQAYTTATISGSTVSGTVAEAVSLTCSSAGKCVGAGFVAQDSGTAKAAVMLENGGGQWGQPVVAPMPANVQSSGSSEVTSDACSSATACVAVGYYPTTSNGTQPFAVPFTVSGTGVTFGTPQQVSLPVNALTTSAQGAFLSGVSCGTGGCTAVGTYETTGSVWTAITATLAGGGAWTAAAVTAPSGASNDVVLDAISCPTSGACEAVGTYGDGSNHTQDWVVQVTNGAADTAQPVTIPGAGPLSASTPSASSFLSLRPGLTAVSCPSAGVCIVAGTVELAFGGSDLPQAIVLPITDGVPGQSTTPSPNGELGFAGLEGISCSDALDCTAVGVQLTIGSSSVEDAQALVATESSGSWSAPTQLQGPSAASTATETLALAVSVACTSPGVCVSAGVDIYESGSGAGATGAEETFFAYSGLPAAITTTSLPAATVGKPYSATLQGSGETGTASWAVTLGSLPAGLTLNASTGVISGTPTAAGQSGFAVAETTDGPPSLTSAATSLSITVASAAPVATISLAYSKVSGRSVVLVLNCSGAPCSGALTVAGVEHLRGSKPIAVDARAGKKPRTRAVTLASRGYSLAAGADTTIVVKLNAKGAKLLRQLHRISTKLALTPAGAAAPALVKTLTFKSRR